MSRILVAGGAGFIGSHLCKELLKQDHEVFCLDDLSTGSMSNILDIHVKNFHWIPQNVCDPIDLEVDEIYNLASPASPIHYQKSPITTFKTNVLGSMNLLELANKNRAKILLASTSEVYGDPDIEIQNESYNGNVNTTGPRACYDEGKRASETLFSDYQRTYGIDIRIARIFNTFGSNMDKNDGRVVSNFICQALQNESLTIYGDGSQTRSFCHVSDTVQGLIGLMSSDYNKPVNIGNTHTTTMKDLALKIIAKTNSESRIKYLPLPQDDPKQRIPDITLAKELFDFTPEYSFDCGLDETVVYFKSLLGV
jgi:UDP-glucuronate decarboxylase